MACYREYSSPWRNARKGHSRRLCEISRNVDSSLLATAEKLILRFTPTSSLLTLDGFLVSSSGTSHRPRRSTSSTSQLDTSMAPTAPMGHHDTAVEVSYPFLEGTIKRAGPLFQLVGLWNVSKLSQPKQGPGWEP